MGGFGIDWRITLNLVNSRRCLVEDVLTHAQKDRLSNCLLIFDVLLAVADIVVILGSFSNDDGDGNENATK